LSPTPRRGENAKPPPQRRTPKDHQEDLDGASWQTQKQREKSSVEKTLNKPKQDVLDRKQPWWEEKTLNKPKQDVLDRKQPSIDKL
jgi:hypothetical protein